MKNGIISQGDGNRYRDTLDITEPSQLSTKQNHFSEGGLGYESQEDESVKP
jgi:hypothetical protein